MKWLGVLACACPLLAAGASARWEYLYVSDGTWSLGLEGGAGVGGHRYAWAPAARALATSIGPILDSWSEFARRWSHRCTLPHIEHLKRVGADILNLPLWIIFILFLAPTALLWRLDRRRARRGHCPKCG